MKVILNSDVDKLGRKGEVVEVAPGYARNFLLPRNLAITATKGAVKQAESMVRAREEKDKRDRAQFEQLASRIASAQLRFEMRASREGQLFGSVTTTDIAEQLSAVLGEEIDRRKVSVEHPIKSLGMHNYSVHLHPSVVPQGTLEVVSDGVVEPEPEPEPHAEAAAEAPAVSAPEQPDYEPNPEALP